MLTAPGLNERMDWLARRLSLSDFGFFIPWSGAARHPHQPPELDFSF
jgi:hypothetical protein